MSSRKRPPKLSRSRKTKLVYEVFEPRKVLAAIFPAYIGGSLNLGDPDSAAPYALADTFELETNPNASKTIYLDFNGHFSSGNSWNHNINFPAWNRSGNSSSFSDAELIEIQKQFQNVAEDFAPFDVNVTTKDPGTAALIKSSFSDQNYGVRVVNTQATGGFGNGIGGVAFLRSFDDSVDNPVFVFNKGVNNGAMTISHEVGHALGLVHDGLNSNEYHPGTGSGDTSWGPILGAPFSRNITQWSNGDYAGSTTNQDDLAVITNSANGINYKVDDAGNTIASASLLETDGNNVFDWGIVERNTDVDFYRFTTSGGQVGLRTYAFAENPNLDIRMRLYTADGTRFASNNPSAGVDAQINRNLAAGTYYLAIDGVGKPGDYSSYGSLGFYSIEGNIPAQVTGNKIGEVGKIADLNHEWKTIQMSRAYSNPIVVAGPATTKGSDPVTVRIRNINSNSFQIRIDEWDYRDDKHTIEEVDYMVVESGTHQLTDGTVLRASKIDSQNHNWNQRTLFGAFDNSDQPPALFASVTTTREDSAVTTRIRNVTNSGFQLRIQEEQGSDYVHVGEEVNWIAIEKGSGQTGASDFYVGDTGRVVSHNDHTINFSPSFESRPSFFAEMQSYFGGDAATVRTRKLANTRAVVFLEEERSADSEIAHTTEAVGYLAIPQGDIYANPANAARINAGLNPSNGLNRGAMVDGDLSAALQLQQSWGEVGLSLGHSHDAQGDHDHGCGCGCEICTGTQNDIESNNRGFHFHVETIETTVSEFVASADRVFTEKLELFSDSLADHIRDSTERLVDQTERELSNFRDSIRKHSFDSFFEQNLGLLSKWF